MSTYHQENLTSDSSSGGISAVVHSLNHYAGEDPFREITIPERLKTGDCILDISPVPEAVWGDGEEILWAKGQSLVIAGNDGTGKTTFGGNLVRARLGLGDGRVLGQPVKPGDRNVLYLAMDRPRQAQASMARLFSPADRDVLRDRLRVWQGPPPGDLAKNHLLLAQLCHYANADTCIVDSLKDAAVGLKEDEIGAGWNRARQEAIVNGTELLEMHHLRKTDGKELPALEDLYGSRWIAAGMGTCVMLHGNPGDPIIRFLHRKPAVSEVGPFDVTIGKDGSLTVSGAIDLAAELRHGALTAQDAARLMFGTKSPTRNETEKARRELAKLEKKNQAVSRPGQRGGPGGSGSTTWELTAP